VVSPKKLLCFGLQSAFITIGGQYCRAQYGQFLSEPEFHAESNNSSLIPKLRVEFSKTGQKKEELAYG